MPKDKSETTKPWPKGIITHPSRLSKKLKTGANMNKKGFEELGIIVSFENNFRPSAKGCKRPTYPTTLVGVRKQDIRNISFNHDNCPQNRT